MAGIPYLLLRNRTVHSTLLPRNFPLLSCSKECSLYFSTIVMKSFQSSLQSCQGLPLRVEAHPSGARWLASRLRVQRYGDFMNYARKNMKKAAFFWKTRLFSWVEIAKCRNCGGWWGNKGESGPNNTNLDMMRNRTWTTRVVLSATRRRTQR